MGKSAQCWVKPNRRVLSRLRLQYEDHNTEFGFHGQGPLEIRRHDDLTFLHVGLRPTQTTFPHRDTTDNTSPLI